jgi:acetyl esterase/lipase
VNERRIIVRDRRTWRSIIVRFFAALLSIACTSFAYADEAVRIEKDVRYLPEDRAEKADLYLPVDDGTKHPGVVIIHGGGWTGGKKDAARETNIGTTLAAHGYVCLSIDYVLAVPDGTNVVWPQNLHDCKTAVRWLRANAERLQLDAEHIGAIGGSAGGHLTAMLAATGPECGLDPEGPYGEFSCRIQCAVDMYGPTDLVTRGKDIAALRKSLAEAPELYRQFSVLTHLDQTDPPFLILHGTADTTVDVEQSKILDEALTKLGVEHQLEIIEEAPHTFHLQPKQKDLRPLVLEFFDRHLKPRIRIALIGDSTMASYDKPPADRPDLSGWGQVFGEYFTRRVEVINHAKSGRSSKSFIREGLWEKTLAAPADYVFVQFGHNDQPGKGDRATDANGDFQDNLRKYIREARAQGMKPVLVTPVARRTYENGKIHTTLQPYADAMQTVGRETQTPVVDLHAASLALFDKLGDDGSADLSASVSDRTHFSRKGALAIAKLVTEALPESVPELKPLLK